MTFDVAVKSGRLAGPWVLSKVVIAGRPALPALPALPTPQPQAQAQPDSRGQEPHGEGFQHHTAWFTEEFLIAHKWQGRELSVVYNRLRRDVGVTIPAADPGHPAEVLVALNEYFYTALVAAGEHAAGHRVPTDTHAAQGARIRAATCELDQALRNRDELADRAAIEVYLSTFDAEPEIGRLLPRDARREHVQKINQLFAEFGLRPETIHRVHGIIAEYWGLAKPHLLRTDVVMG
jgi:hypothetical protein